ncbi:hypothetical protein [Hymenobacter taeanensis]|nr:hypothetical protein [Hymenobacter taeanensis]
MCRSFPRPILEGRNYQQRRIFLRAYKVTIQRQSAVQPARFL